MRLLPCLRFGSYRWWLPRSHDATETLAGLLLRSEHRGATSRTDATSSTVARTVSCFREDPPLFLFAAISYPGRDATLTELASWLAENACGLLAGGDAFLGAPEISRPMQHRWSELHGYHKTLPPSRWIDEAHRWLEVTGPAVPEVWRQQWARVSWDDWRINRPDGESSPDMLQQLARRMQHLECIERSFDRRLHKSKLAALKQLAYGLSHEINNPLANISSRAQQLQRDEVEPRRRQVLQKIVDQVYRAHEMIADLMFYANPPEPRIAQWDLNELIAEVASEFVDEAKQLSIRLETETSSDAFSANIDGEMVGEALRVLLRNSIEAIGAEGTIVVSVVRDNESALIHVADSGPGLLGHAREHAFDPYFSGREAGRGLGLGLCRAYRIAKLHHADITLAGGPIGCVATISLRIP
ncbi:sensor histidine kinase [Novipirellula artificiosorum]|uniref:histidine kinase n=1 Tax=Novipirellula artificiosorum TaxID=2528016 RepID=A0A5C6E2P0_9BACT|nr:histidine kinase dimerization/phospho-acceptor domain-containing protein [Novipirellula artificiosorum]TWU42237.1 Sensor protein ZraS [Novipirellula artificiosorum]